jgi:hypothetical protein
MWEGGHLQQQSVTMANPILDRRTYTRSNLRRLDVVRWKLEVNANQSHLTDSSPSPNSKWCSMEELEESHPYDQWKVTTTSHERRVVIFIFGLHVTHDTCLDHPVELMNQQAPGFVRTSGDCVEFYRTGFNRFLDIIEGY